MKAFSLSSSSLPSSSKLVMVIWTWFMALSFTSPRTTGFVVTSPSSSLSSSSSSHSTSLTTSTSTTIATTTKTTTRLHVGGPLEDGSSAMVGDSFSELTSALAKASAATSRQSRWTKLFLTADTEEEEEEEKKNAEQQYVPGQQQPIPQKDFVWMLEPTNVETMAPSCTIVFTGGAGLGQFPHVAYNELLSRVSDRLNAVILAAPYSVGLDHFALAKETGEKLRRGVLEYDRKRRQDNDEDDIHSNSNGNTNGRRPVYSLGHSLGCKLQTIYLAATGQEMDGHGFMAFNNFSFAQTVKMARSFTDEIRRTSTRAGTINDAYQNDDMGGAGNDAWLGNLFDFAEVALGAVGLDFSPNAQDTDRLIELRFKEQLQAKTRLFVMDDDNMDSSTGFIADCCNARESSSVDGPSVSGIQGGHLAPVFFQWNLDESMAAASGGRSLDDLPPEAREIAREAMGGFQGASFGDEPALNELVNEICGWIMGKAPTRGPLSSREAGKSSGYTISGSS